MTRQVLDIGQCGPDHFRIAHVLNEHFDVHIEQAHSRSEALRKARAGSFDLILVNRLLDADGDSGMEIIEALKSDESTATVPVMLVSNFSDAQQTATAAGAVPGFGKASLDEPATIEALARHLRD